MRVRKRFDAEKNRKIEWISGILTIFSEPWCRFSCCEKINDIGLLGGCRMA
jgi:hypothetical protein